MTNVMEFKSGDNVIHTQRREWGVGVVEKTTKILEAGQSAQRVTVRFKHRGRVTINTAVAPLLAGQSEQAMTRTDGSDPIVSRPGGWLDSLTQEKPTHAISALPEEMTDPFVSHSRRLTATLDSYRFSLAPRPLIEWAITQTNLDDPLTQYTRQELEQAFERFARDRDNHLKDLVRTAKRQDESALLHGARERCRYPAGKAALLRAIKG